MITETPNGGIVFSAPFNWKLTPFVVRDLKAGVNWRGRKWCAANKHWEFTPQGSKAAERIIKHFYEDLPDIPPAPAHCPEARVYRVEGETRFIWLCGEMNDAQYAEFAKIASMKARRYNWHEQAWSLPLMYFDRFKRWLAADDLFKNHGYVIAGDAPPRTRDEIIDAAHVAAIGYFPDRFDDRGLIARMVVALHNSEDRYMAVTFLSYMPDNYREAVYEAAREIKELGL